MFSMSIFGFSYLGQKNFPGVAESVIFRSQKLYEVTGDLWVPCGPTADFLALRKVRIFA